MLKKFHTLYPTGCLISELLQIYQGKYLVRVSVQIEGVTRTTGMAAAETLEMAEDRALDRALTVLAMDTEANSNISSLELKPQATSPTPTPPLPPTPTPPTPDTSTYSWEKERVPQAKPTTATPPLTDLSTPISPTFTDQSAPISPTFTDQSELFGAMSTPQPSGSNDWRTPSVTPTENHPSSQPTNNVTPFIPRNPVMTTSNEPEDLSDPIAKIDFEMDRLGWSKEEGREYLIKTYKKKARSLLNEEELRGFLKYLESQPTPKDPGF